MPKRPSFTPIRDSSRKSPWKIEIPARWSSTGKRERFYFLTKGEAQGFADRQKIRIENFGVQGGGILSPTQTEQALKAHAVVADHGVSLNEVVADWVTRREAANASVTFEAAIEAFKEHLERTLIKGRPVSAAYRSNTRQTFARFAALNKKNLTEITPREIGTICQKLTPHVKNACLAHLSSLFGWAGQTPRHWIDKNPVQSIPRESTGGHEVRTFAPADIRRVLEASSAEPDLLMYHVLGFFAGIRPEELPKVEWDFINLSENTIVLPGGVTKTRKRRVIALEETCLSWIKWVIGSAGIQSGPIVPLKNLRKRLRAVRDAAKVAWIQDGMRHTYASAWLAIYKDEHRLRENLGHKSARELWDHYHKSLTQAEAKAIWEILPDDEKIITLKGVQALDSVVTIFEPKG